MIWADDWRWRFGTVVVRTHAHARADHTQHTRTPCRVGRQCSLIFYLVYEYVYFLNAKTSLFLFIYFFFKTFFLFFFRIYIFCFYYFYFRARTAVRRYCHNDIIYIYIRTINAYRHELSSSFFAVRPLDARSRPAVCVSPDVDIVLYRVHVLSSSTRTLKGIPGFLSLTVSTPSHSYQNTPEDV